MEDLPDTASTASRFAWGNVPDNEDPCFSSSHPRPFYDYTLTSSTTPAGLYQYEGSAGGCGAAPLILVAQPSNYIGQTESLIAGYLSAWAGTKFQLTGQAETFLGPGARFGPAHVGGTTPFNDPSQQRGGAIVATQFDSTGDVLQVAHVLSSLSGVSKGGGGKQPQNFAEYDPAKAADVLKDRFVDRGVALGVDLKTGTAGYATPTLISLGVGAAPYGLDYALAFKAAPSGCSRAFGPCTGPVEGGWSQNWDVRFNNSGSGLEGMGATSPFAAAGALVAFMAMQDVFGQGGLADLDKDVFAALVADWWRQTMVANVATVSRGFSGAQYVRLVDGTWMAPVGAPGVLTQTGQRAKVRDGCQPVASGEYPDSTSRRWDHSAVTFSLRGAAGDVLSVAPWTWSYETDNACAVLYGYQPVSWTWPQGPSLTFGYDYQQGVTGITTSLGRSMAFTGAFGAQGILTATAVTTAGTLTAGQQVNGAGNITGIADAAGEASSFAYVPPTARSASQRPVPYPQLAQVFEPVSATAPALQFGYDTRGLVETAADATSLQWGTRGAYAWFLAPGARGERDDPDGGAYAVYYDTDGDAVRNIDEIGREVDSVWDGRHRVTSRTFPESDQEQFAYDASDNVIAGTKLPKTGSPLAPIVVAATYDPTWNKLASITDAMGNVTNFTYYPSGAGASLMSQAQRPAVGGTRPTYTFQYDAIGLATRSVDPTGVTTTHAYDGFGNLTSTTQAAAAVGSNPALNLTTSFTPDPIGNVTAVVDPRGNATTTQFDNMRRKVGERNLNGGTGALPLMAKAFVYDANGRLTTENRATGFDVHGNPSDWQSWLTAYTPTGKTAATTDPLGHATVTSYDALDRPVQVTDASGQVTGKTYDLAGQELTEIHGLGSPQQITYATTPWWPDGEKKSVKDANNNTINLAYDGFNRLSTITHPDSTTETSQYDPDGDLTIWTNRGGFGVVRCYDVLNRKVSETGYTGATNTGACPALTGGSLNQNVRSWDFFPVTLAYDLAGRLTGASSARLAITYAYDAAGRPTGRGGNWTTRYAWDGAGNMTSVTYPEGSVFTYQHDALNRTTAALQGTTTLASLTYDPLGRRSVLAFGDASSQTWGYDAADRLVTLAHAFPNAPDDVTLTYGYDPADREVSKATSNPAYQWSPAVASTAYAAANALNQYPSVAGYPYTYWPEGPLEQNSALKGDYDENDRLMFAYLTVTPGVVDPNNYVENLIDPMGHLMYHNVHPAAGVPYPAFYHSTDGLRPETVLDWQYSQPVSGSATFQGYRRYVLGPDPDERWAFIDFDAGHTIYYPHTDRMGTTIALSANGAAAAKYAYDAYGQSAAPLAEVGPGAASYAFRYTGQRLDGGTGLYDDKARFYWPGGGRFLQPDQAGLDQGPNLYLYVGDDPVNGTDPSGECTGSNIPGSCDTSTSPVSVSAGPASGAGAHQNSQNSVTARAVAHHDASMCQGQSSCEKTVFDKGKADADKMMRPYGLAAVAGIFGPLLLPATELVPAAAPEAATPASTPVGRRGNPMDVRPGTNAPGSVGGRQFTGHAFDQMQGRGITPSSVENTIQTGSSAASRGETTVFTSDQMKVIVTSTGKVITVIPR